MKRTKKKMSRTRKRTPLAVIDSIASMRSYIALLRAKKKRIGFVPTMGALHEGHISLVHAAAKECDAVIVSIFVNPTQFAPTEDLSKYPRTFDRDRAMLEAAGTAAIFYPTNEMMYPAGYATYITVDGLSSILCGVTRPDHFRGVATVVTKLFTIVAPDIAYFGEKDYQQAALIARMTEDLDLPVTIRTCPIVREADGLAMSSRNVYLSAAERTDAPLIYRSLMAVRKAYRNGERDAAELRSIMRTVLAEGLSLRVDYIEFVDSRSLEPRAICDVQTRIIMAVYCGKTRLIDNMRLA